MARTSKPRSNIRKKAPRRKMKMPRRLGSSGVPEKASLTEVITLTQNAQLGTDTAYSYNALSLGQTGQPFVRAQQVAEQYQFFRIRQAKYIIKPTYDTFAGGGPMTVPYVYWIINRTGESLSLDLAGLTSRGAKPLRLDDKNVTIAYRPSVGVAAVQGTTGTVLNASDQYRISPWLSTNNNVSTVVWNPSQVLHYGHYMMINNGGALGQYDVVIQIEFEFKGPRFVDVSPAIDRPPPKEQFVASV